MDFEGIKQLDDKYCIKNYGRFNVGFSHGKGAKLYDFDGSEYIDFASGIGVSSIGHCHPLWLKAVSEQIGKLAHVSNLYYTEAYALLAPRLTAFSGMKRAFFCNSGAEANEAAIKLARKYSKDKYGEGRSTIVTLLKSFHGRTMATLTATGQPEYHVHFDPFPSGFKYAEANDIGAVKNAMTDDVCAVIVEGIQGEGGVIPLLEGFIKELASLALEKDILLIFDEVQTGVGRTGHMYCCERFGINPDLITLAKGLGGGLPIGALLAGEKCEGVLGAGTHGSTFGGNPVACAGANAVLDVVVADGFMEDVKRKGTYIKNRIADMSLPFVKDVRGHGLMIGIELEGIDVKETVKGLLDGGLVALSAGNNVLRLLPPLTITDKEVEAGMEIMLKCMKR